MTGMDATLQPTLSGLRVLELGHFVAAPFCTRLLADLGADVIKVEPRAGDPVRHWGEMVAGRSLWWSMHGRNKRSMTLDLKSPIARTVLLELVAQCDVVVENFRPGQLARLGLDDTILRNANPDLIIAHISGYGQTGPGRDRAAFGVIGEAVGGLRYLTNHMSGVTDLPPVRVGVSIGDSIAGLYAAFGVMAALWKRDSSRQGDGRTRTLDVALTESVLSMMEGMLPEYGALGKVKQPTGGGIATAAPSNVYPTKNGTWVLIAANSEPLFARLAKLIGLPELIDQVAYVNNPSRVRNAAALDAIISDWSRTLDADVLVEQLSAADIPNSRVYTVTDIAADQQYRDRRMVREVDDPAFDQPLLHAGVVPHVVEAPGEVRWPGPGIGQHTDEILGELLGMDIAAIDMLRTQGAV